MLAAVSVERQFPGKTSVSVMASPLFGQSTAINLFRDTSNNRRVQFGTQFTF
jgi:hypothetical protein